MKTINEWRAEHTINELAKTNKPKINWRFLKYLLPDPKSHVDPKMNRLVSAIGTIADSTLKDYEDDDELLADIINAAIYAVKGPLANEMPGGADIDGMGRSWSASSLGNKLARAAGGQE